MDPSTIHTFIKINPSGDIINSGWGNGYLVLRLGHPYYGKSSFELDMLLDTEREITYTEYVRDTDYKGSMLNDSDYIIGFHTCNAGDNLDNWSKEKVFDEVRKIYNELYKVSIQNKCT